MAFPSKLRNSRGTLSNPKAAAIGATQKGWLARRSPHLVVYFGSAKGRIRSAERTEVHLPPTIRFAN